MRLCHQLAVLSISLLPLMAAATPADFATIPKRNVFGLRSPPPEPKIEEVKPALPQVTFQGVTTILGSCQVLLKIQIRTKPAPTDIACILGVGQEREGVKVRWIDPESGTVWLMNQDTELVLSLKR